MSCYFPCRLLPLQFFILSVCSGICVTMLHCCSFGDFLRIIIIDKMYFALKYIKFHKVRSNWKHSSSDGRRSSWGILNSIPFSWGSGRDQGGIKEEKRQNNLENSLFSIMSIIQLFKIFYFTDLVFFLFINSKIIIIHFLF